jgi:methylenetetrahydrofolate reductase (NADPH)
MTAEPVSRDTRAESLLAWLEGARYEILPTVSAEASVREHLPTDRVVTITSSPTKGLEPTLALSERLAAAGYEVVPHLAARMISGRTQLAELVNRLTSSGVTRIFVPAGDADAVGDYADALGLLEDLAALEAPFDQIGITGYPESHPRIHDDVTIQAMWDKRLHATHIVSNLTFSATAVEDWVGRLRARGVATPVLIGVPGPVERTKLLAMAAKIGVGESTRFLAKNTGLFARLASPGGFTGERFIRQCAAVLNHPSAAVAGLHVFTFNQIAETEAWRSALVGRLRG